MTCRITVCDIMIGILAQFKRELKGGGVTAASAA